VPPRPLAPGGAWWRLVAPGGAWWRLVTPDAAALRSPAIPRYPANACRLRISLYYIRLQPLLHMVTASTTYGYSLYYIWLQPLLHMVTASATYGSQPLLHMVHSLYYIWFTASTTYGSQPLLHMVHSLYYIWFTASTTYGSQPLLHMVHSLYYIWFTASTTYLANAYRLRISVWTTVDARLSRSAARPTTRLLWPHAQMRPELCTICSRGCNHM